MNSPHQREQLPDLLSDALGPTERARVESHLAQCEQCARELRELQQMQQTLASLPAATSPDRVRANVRAALRASTKRSWAIAALQGNRANPAGARRALPFALPARQLAWGGAVALGAVGLMLLARPSLQDSPTGQMAPTSETELAAHANADAASGALSDKTATGAAKKSVAKPSAPKTKGTAKPAATAPASDGTLALPDSVASPPPLPFPHLAQPESLAPIPELETPSFDLSPEIAPTPTRKPDASRPQKRPDEPAAVAKPSALAQSKPPSPSPTPSARVTAPKQAPSTPKPEEKKEAPPAQSSVNSETARETSNADISESSGASRADWQARSKGSAALEPPMVSRTAPVAPAPDASRKSVGSSGWPGGEVSTNLKNSGNGAPILTMSVDIAIGNARLFLLLPTGETQVWRGSMNAAPVEIELPNLAGKVRSGQKIRARLEQIDGEGNPKASTTFDLLWP